MRKFFSKALPLGLLLASCVALPGLSQAEELVTPITQQGDTAQQTPRNGQPMDDVERRFGTPQRAEGPIGEPPITIWHYASFSVYFEYDRVIHTVLKPK